MFLRSDRLSKVYELRDGISLIGRRGDCDIVLDSNQVSKKHLMVDVNGTRVRVRDDDSRNNSKVNRDEIRGFGWVDLKPGDAIDVCGYDFRLQLDDSPSGTSGSCVVEPGDIGSGFTGPGSRSIPLSERGLADSKQFSQLKALIAMTGTLRDVLQTEDVLERAVDILFQIFPTVDRAAICFIEEESHVVTPKWWRVRLGDPDDTIRISQNIGRQVAETSQAMISADAIADFGDVVSVHALSMRSVMCCPLVDAEGQVFGMIHVDAGRPNVFNEMDLEVLAAVAMQVALAINCARLHAIAIEDELLRRDVEQARAVQQRYLPDSSPSIDGYELASFYRAARHVGGDYFDYVSLPNGRTAIVLGDVVGKGVPAALTMVRLATETHAGLEVNATPGELVSRLNQRFENDFITLAVLVLDPVAHQIAISNAGHEPPLLRSEGSVSLIGLETSGLPLGVVQGDDYDEITIPISPGESLLLFSDGFADAENQASGERFGSDSIAKSFGKFRGSASETIDHMVSEVDQFIEGGTQFDDMCMVCLKRL